MKKGKILFYFGAMVIMLLTFNNSSLKAASNDETINSVYDGELGFFYTEEHTVFKVWSSSASNVKVMVDGVTSSQGEEMGRDLSNNNVWVKAIQGDLLGKEYSYTVEYSNGDVFNNVLDPYGKILNSDKTKNIIFNNNIVTSENWNLVQEINVRDINKVIYGVNVKNFTINSSWMGSEENRGKLLGLTEGGTKYGDISTGFDYVKTLGVTYVELSNISDDLSPFVIDKAYHSDEVIDSGMNELRNVIVKYNESGMGIILTIDFTKLSSEFNENLERLDKGYYISEGLLDIEKPMVRKYLTDIVKYWVKEFKVSGLKINNMASLDVALVKDFYDKIKDISENILFYGDGSYANELENGAGENNLSKLSDIGMINHSLNHALVGNLENNSEKGLLTNDISENNIESLKFSLFSGVDNGLINYDKVKGISYKNSWGNTKSFQFINYLSDEEGLSFRDKLFVSGITTDTLSTQKYAIGVAIMMLSGGIPHIYSGDEFLVSYLNTMNEGVCTPNNDFCFYDNSLNKGIPWQYLSSNGDSVNILKSFLNFRRNGNKAILVELEVVKKNLKLYTSDSEGLFGYIRKYPKAYNKELEKISVYFNFSNDENNISSKNSDGIKSAYNYNDSNRVEDKIIMKPISLYIEYQEKQPFLNSWIALLLVIGVISLMYYANILLNKRLVNKYGYDSKSIKRKYRPFVKDNKNVKQEEKETDSEETKTEDK